MNRNLSLKIRQYLDGEFKKHKLQIEKIEFFCDATLRDKINVYFQSNKLNGDFLTYTLEYVLEDMAKKGLVSSEDYFSEFCKTQ